MSKWKDNHLQLDDAAISILSDIAEIDVQCCSNVEFHVYAHEFDTEYEKPLKRISVWAWCSNCRSYVHFQIPKLYAPNWKNSPEIDSSMLTVEPAYLEEHKAEVDRCLQLYVKENSHLRGGAHMNYLLMHKRTTVLELDIDKLGMIAKIGAVSAPEHLPVGVRTIKSGVDRASFNEWWADRCIPASRSGVRDALQALGVAVPQQLLSRSYGLSLSDHYWLKPTDSTLTWEQINFFDNPFSDDIGDILFGKQHGKEIDFTSPDSTSDGNLKKRWRIINGKRCLMKGGSGPFYQQPFNEVIASAVMRRLGIAHIPYTVTWGGEHPYSFCENFVTPDTELVPAWRIYQLKKKPNSSSVFQHYMDICTALGIQNITCAMDEMLVVDFLIANEDRHFNNFGLLRNPETLEWIGAAPIFDSGSSLGYDSLPNRFLSANIPCKPFKKTHAAQIQLVSSFDWIDFSKLDGIADEIQEILFGERTAEFIDEARRNAIANAVVKRIAMLKEIAQQHTNTDDLGDDLTENVAQTY